VNQDALSVDLPKASTGGDVQEIFSVVLSASGQTQVDGEAVVSDDEVLPRARAAQRANRELRAVIKADGAVMHARVMSVLDALREAFVSKVCARGARSRRGRRHEGTGCGASRCLAIQATGSAARRGAARWQNDGSRP
jgi:hypothetical protein